VEADLAFKEPHINKINMQGINLEVNLNLSKAQVLIDEMHDLLLKRHALSCKPKNIVLDTWIDYQPLINGRTMVWYYCNVTDEIQVKII